MHTSFRQFFMLIVSILFIVSCNGPGKNDPPSTQSGPYAGSTEPGKTPALFAPGFITTGLYERDMAISPVDGKEIYFSVFLGDWVTIMVTRNAGNEWTRPEVASFARDTAANFCEPAFTPDGKHLLFLCTFPLDGGAQKPGWQDQNIWMVTRDENGAWGDPVPLPSEINQEAQFFPSISRKGDFYFCRTDTATGISAIFQTTWPLAEHPVVQKLPEPVNSAGSIFNACISPDGSCLVGCATGRDIDQPARKASYYAFFKRDGGWSDGFVLDSLLQMEDAQAIAPAFSPDGRFFFFATNKRRAETTFANGAMDLDFFQNRRAMPGNGNSDIYWIDAGIIFDLDK